MKILKSILKIVGRVLAVAGLTVYVVVALVNYSVVQSFIGSVVGDYFSKEWGGTVKIGSLHAMPFDHLTLDNLLLVSPDGDTILDSERLSVRFKKFPYSDMHLSMDRVYLRNTYYHFESYDNGGINLDFIINYYATAEADTVTTTAKPFTVEVGSLVLNNVHYKMDLPDSGFVPPVHGVDIPHMEFLDIHARFKHVKVVNEDVTCRVVRMTTMERSGFKVNNISGDVHVGRYDITATNMEVETANSRILTDVKLSYPDWMPDYVTMVNHEVTLKDGTTVAMSDVAYWAPVLWGVDAQIEAQGEADGPVNDLHTDGLRFSWGRDSKLDVAGHIKGLPLIDTATMTVDVERLSTTVEDVEQVLSGLPGFKFPEQLKQLEYIEMQARVNGGWQQTSTANIALASGIGDLRADATMTPTLHGNRFSVEANSDGLGLSMLGSEWLTHSGFTISATGQIDKHVDWRRMSATIDGALTNTVVRGVKLESTSVVAKLERSKFEAEVISSDPNANMKLEAYANLADSLHRFKANVEIENLALSKFGLAEAKDDNPVNLHTRLSVRAVGNSLDELSGTVRANESQLGKLKINSIILNAQNAGLKHIVMTSDLLDATVSGDFAYADLPLMLRQLSQQVMPEIFNPMQPIDSATASSISERNLAFNLRWNDRHGQLKAIAPSLLIAPNTVIDGRYNGHEQLKVVMRSDSIRFGSVVMGNIGLSGHPDGDHYLLDIEAQNLDIGKMPLTENVNVKLNSNAEQAVAELIWGSDKTATHGDLQLRLRDNIIEVLKPDFYVGDDLWQLGIGQMSLINEEGGLKIESENISIENSVQKISGRLQLRGLDNDCVELRFNRFHLDNLCDILLQNSNLHVGGDINGRFSMFGLNQTPYFNANLTIDSCTVNNQHMGNVNVRSNWNAELNIINLQLASEQLHANGWLGLDEKNPDVNFNVDFNQFELALVAPLLSSFTSRFEGRLHGNFDISGTIDRPLILGEAYVEEGALKVDVTNVTYTFDDSIRFNNNQITLKNFEIKDPNGNIATVNGKIHYNDLKNVGLNLQMQTDNLLVLNQKTGEEFYGTLLAGAEGSVTGNLDDLKIAVRARTNPGSTLTVPVNDQRQVKSQNYITFVGDQPVDNESIVNQQKKSSNFNLELDLAITPDVQLNLPMDFSEVGANVGASGRGDLHLSMTGNETPKVLGNYEITSGTMKLTLVSVLEKSFSIEPGSSLNFQGNLPDARFDLNAVYSQRVNLSTLTGSLSTVDNTQKYLQVENVISISGTMQNPTIKFDIRLPNADQSVEEEVFAYIDRNSERDMLNQTMSLLLMGSFYNASGNSAGNGNLLNNSLSSGYSMVASSVGNFVGEMVQFVDVNVDYKAATDLTNEQIDLNISKDWGRWYLESTLGYGGESRELESSVANGTVIDALIGYRLSPLVHLFVYNRTNTNDYTRIDLPYKQGAGIKLTKDFNRWSDLFKRKGKK
ncbi:MAG: translocation/assembly module TamB domain-containing protein [Bacteroidales bacterium]|nr:translocation/assembly module TamB domain-containing protein [Bacteroidales bacterium]